MRVLEHTSFLRKKHMLFALLFALRPMVAMGVDRVLNVGGTAIALSETCDSEHKLNVLYNGTTYCAPATTETLTNTLHVLHNGTTYSICNGSCGSGGYVMPETPPEPIVLPETCEWTQTNENAYLLSDGRQYFDTKVPVDSSVNIDVTAQVVSGTNARIFGVVDSTCYYDLVLDKQRRAHMRFGTSSSAVTKNLTEAQSKQKIRYYTETDGDYKNFRLSGSGVSGYLRKKNAACTSQSTLKVLTNKLFADTLVDPTQSGGIKLYRIIMKDSSNKLIHDFQPVAKGTNICGVTPPTNAMWDFVTKKLYYPAGTGQMGYGVDP